jgi:Protein of unknown function (DUF1064)
MAVIVRIPTSSKYHAHQTTLDGMRFDSKKEASRWAVLRLLERAGEIRGLERQNEFPLKVDGVTIGLYRTDFTYYEHGQLVVEDCKGYRTALYRWKKRHFETQYKLLIRET